ncbi:MAG TPA: pitrilysin family protein [Gemmatimonadales bacterium]
MKGLSSFGVALLTVIAAAPLWAQFPTAPPPPAPQRPMQFPPFREARLDNGIQIILVENHELPIVSLSLAMRAGSRLDPAGREGLVEMVAELLTKGTATRTAEQIAAEIEGVGASLSAGAGNDLFTLSTSSLTDHSDLAFGLLADVLLNATFPVEELELARQRTLSSLQLAKSDPSSLAGRQFSRRLYGDHPYGREVTEASVRALTPEELRDFAGHWLKPQGALLVMAGDITLDGARRLVERHLGPWNGGAPTPPMAAAPPTSAPTSITLVHRPGSAQSNIVVGNLALGPTDRAHTAAAVGNKILGGGADSRLFAILREQKSWTYGASSGITRSLDVGHFSAGTEVRTPVTDSALVELLHQLRRMRTESVADSELTAAKGYLIGSFPRSIETPQQVASQVSTVRLLGLGDDHLRTYRERLEAVTPVDIRAAAQRVIRPDSAVIVVVGDGQQLYDRLAVIAPVSMVDIEGRPMTREALTASAGPVQLDPSQLVARRDSFVVLVQGNPFGYMTAEIERADTALVYTEETQIPAVGLQQRTTVVLDPRTLAVRSVVQTGTGAGQAMETRLTYAGGRVSGRAQTPDPRAGSPKIVDVDTALAQGTTDVNAFQALVAALALADGVSFTVPAFEASENAVRTMTVKVSGEQDVTVPAGTFPVYRIEVSGPPQAFVFFVTREAPRRLVKIELVGQPLGFELVK